MLMLFMLAQVAGWQVTEKRDPMNDQLEVHATLRGDNAELIFMCGNGKPVLIYQPDEFLGGGPGRYGTAYDLRDFTYRFDASKPELESWKYLDRYAVAYSTANAVRFVTSMIKSQKLVVRALRYDRRTIDSTFDLAGSPAAFHDAFERCGIR